MPTIRPCADLRNNYNEISELCHEYSKPVFITKDRTNDFAVMSIETYESVTGKLAFEEFIKKRAVEDVISLFNTIEYDEDY